MALENNVLNQLVPSFWHKLGSMPISTYSNGIWRLLLTLRMPLRGVKQRDNSETRINRGLLSRLIRIATHPSGTRNNSLRRGDESRCTAASILILVTVVIFSITTLTACGHKGALQSPSDIEAKEKKKSK